MKKLFAKAVVLVCLGLICALCASAQSAPATTDKAKDEQSSAEQEIRRLNTAESEAFVHRDAEALAHIWSDDMVVTNPLNKFVTKEQVLNMVKSGFLVITAYERRIEYLRFYGDTAIVAGSENVTWSGKMPNAGKSQTLRFTGIWMKQQGRWQEVARHANIVPQP